MIRRPEKAGLPGLTLVAAALLLVGCGDRFFGAGNDGPPLPGERISLMSLTPEIETDPNARDIAIELPPALAGRGRAARPRQRPSRLPMAGGTGVVAVGR